VLGRIDLAELTSRVAERSASIESGARHAGAGRAHARSQRTAGGAAVHLAHRAGELPRRGRHRARRAQRRAGRADTTRVGLRDGTLVAPIAGIVAKRHVVPGEKLAMEQQVLTIVDLARLELAGSVGTHEVARLAAGMPVQVQVEGVDQPVAGRMARIAPAAEPGTRSIGVTIELANPKETLRAGQYAVARWTLADDTRAPDAAAAAVGNTAGQDHVWVIENGQLARRAVTLGRRDERERPGRGAAAACKPASQVLAARFDNLREGAKASVVASKAAARGLGRGVDAGACAEVRGPAMWMTRVSINNPVFATMVMVALCVLGLFSLQQAGRGADARHQLPRRLDGGAVPRRQRPRRWSARSIKPLEEAVNSVAGVKRITSRSAAKGRGQMSIEFGSTPTWAAPCRRCATASRPCRPAFRGRQGAAPSRAGTTTTASRWSTPALLSKTRSARELSILGEQLVGKRLQRVEGVARVRSAA
jgi:membrane fusion protein (multidrug efflux system)